MKDNPKSGTKYTENFTLQHILGEGGIGRVFLATDKNIGREVALKELKAEKLGPHKERVQSRFIRESKLSGRLQHPGIVPVYEMGTKPDGTPFYVMKYVQGETLDHVIRESSFGKPEESFRRRMAYLDNLIAVSEAIGYAHSQGIIHRDLKPGNVILGNFGETVILDWGLAKKIGERIEESVEAIPPGPEAEDDSLQTRAGAKLGTPSYMAPEQIDPRFGGVDQRTDVYALGIMLCILLTGEKPYAGKSQEVMEQIASDAPSPSPYARASFIPPELAAICEKAMAKKKEDRFANAAEFAAELRAYRDGRLVSIYAYSRTELLKRFIARNKIILAACAAVVAAIIIGAAFSLNFAVDAQRARQKAEGALVEVTNLSESSMILARNVTQRMNDHMQGFLSDMEANATRLQKYNLHQPEIISPLLKNLKDAYPATEAFAVAPQDAGVTVSYPANMLVTFDQIQTSLEPFKGKDFIMGDVFTTPTNLRLFAFKLPIKQKTEIKGTLIALLNLDKIMPSLFAFNPITSDYQLWCMRANGYILYDEDPKQVGKMLFADEMYAAFPELLQFGKKIRAEPWGVGHYSFLAKNGVDLVYKVAAWDTIESTDWKIVVTHPYTVR